MRTFLSAHDKMTEKVTAGQKYVNGVLSMIFDGAKGVDLAEFCPHRATLVKYKGLVKDAISEHLRKIGVSVPSPDDHTIFALALERLSKQQAGAICSGLDCKKGRPPVLEDDIELRLFQWIVFMKENNQAVRPATLRKKAEEFFQLSSTLRQAHGQPPPDDIRFGKFWMTGFLQRGFERTGVKLTLKTEVPIELSRIRNFNEGTVSRFYQILKTVYQKLGFFEKATVDNPAKCIINIDECSIPSEHVLFKGKVLSVAGDKKTERKIQGSGGHITAIAGIRAYGVAAPICLVYPDTGPSGSLNRFMQEEDLRYQRTENGYTTSQ